MGHRLHVLTILTLAFVWTSVRANTPPESTEDPAASPLYMLTYDHGGLVLWGRDHFVQYLQTAAGKGIAVFNRGTMGAVREKDGGFSIPLAYAAYYIWGTRMLSGDFEYEFALYPFTGAWPAADLHRRAVEYNFPPVGLAAASADGPLGQTFRPIQVESADAMVSALYSRSGGTYVRMYEYRSTGGTASLGYAAGPARMIQVDLAGHDVGASPDVLTMKPWEIRTVRLERSIE